VTSIPHVKIALTTNNLVEVDANFIAAKQVVFYDVTHNSTEFLDCVQFGRGAQLKKKGPGGGVGCSGDEPDDEGTVDRLTAMVESLQGCAVLFTCGLSDPQAVRVKNINVFPVKMERTREISDVIDHLQSMLTAIMPPLWLRRALRDSAGQTFYLEEQDI
jgi:nitrogen fixation protein NifX